MSHQRYFNFPICLLEDFLTDTDPVLENILNYSLYSYSLSLDAEDKVLNMINTCIFYDFEDERQDFRFMKGQTAYKNAVYHAPKVGINTDIFWDFYHNEKTEFEKVCLLAFLAMKSIIGNDSYHKLDNKYLLSRMNGRAHSQGFEWLPEVLQKYANEYQIKKIKNELKNSWGLKTYSRYTRGFYISFKLSLEQLMYEAEKKRIVSKRKQEQLAEKALLKKVMERLANEEH